MSDQDPSLLPKPTPEEADASLDYAAMLTEAQSDAPGTPGTKGGLDDQYPEPVTELVATKPDFATEAETTPTEPTPEQAERQRKGEVMQLLEDNMEDLNRLARTLELVDSSEEGFAGNLKAQMQEVKERLDRVPEGTAKRLGLDYFASHEKRFQSWLGEERVRAERFSDLLSAQRRRIRTTADQLASPPTDKKKVVDMINMINYEYQNLLSYGSADQEQRAVIRNGLTRTMGSLAEELERTVHVAASAEDNEGRAAMRQVAAAARTGEEEGDRFRAGLYKAGEQLVSDSSRNYSSTLQGRFARMDALYKA